MTHKITHHYDLTLRKCEISLFVKCSLLFLWKCSTISGWKSEYVLRTVSMFLSTKVSTWNTGCKYWLYCQVSKCKHVNFMQIYYYLTFLRTKSLALLSFKQYEASFIIYHTNSVLKIYIYIIYIVYVFYIYIICSILYI